MKTQLESLLMEGYTVEMSAKSEEGDYIFTVSVKNNGEEVSQGTDSVLTKRYMMRGLIHRKGDSRQ